MTRSKEYPLGNYDKLVRDRVSQQISDSGRVAITHVAAGDEYVRRLQAKLREEVSELIAAKTETEFDEEVGDVIEVLHAYVQQAGRDMRSIEAKRQTKRTINGGFATGTVLERVEKPRQS